MIAAIAGLTSCTSTINVVSSEKYDKGFETVKTNLSEQGYRLSGHKGEDKMQTDGKAGADIFHRYTYTFSNPERESVEIVLKTKPNSSKYCDCNYYTTTELLGCKTSKSTDYEKICGDSSTIKQTFGKMEKDKKVKIFDAKKTYLLGVSIFTAAFGTLLYFLVSGSRI